MTRNGVSVFSRILIGSPHARLIDVLTRKPDREFTKKEIAEEVGIGRTTLYRIWDDLERMKALTPTRKIGAVTLYRLNRESPATQSILGIRERLKMLSKAVAKFENDRLRDAGTGQLHDAEADPIAYLARSKATSATTAVQIQSDAEARKKLDNLMGLGLVAKNEKGYYLTQLGQYAASGARSSTTLSQDGEVLSSIDVALQVINQEIKKLKSGVKLDAVTK